jgi:phosphoglycolate phosphatase
MLINFDYDGVIADSFDALLVLAVRAQSQLGWGRPPTASDFRRIENLTFDDLARRIGIPEQQAATYAASVFALQRGAWDVSLFPAVVSVLHQLAADHELVVITASEGAAVAGTLDAAGVRGCFAGILGGELGLSKAARIDRARGEAGADASDTLMVGDAISDIRQGKAAGVRTVAVTWGFQDRDLLADEHPDFIADTPADLLTIAT